MTMYFSCRPKCAVARIHQPPSGGFEGNLTGLAVNRNGFVQEKRECPAALQVQEVDAAPRRASLQRKETLMAFATLALSTAAIFLVLDALMLTFVMRPLFERHIGGLLLADFRIGPAALFYAAYVAGLIYLVSWPALKTGTPVILPAAIIGAMAYGTYEFTSYAILRDWHISMVLTDTIWGTVLTAVSAWGGVAVTRALITV
jgi:uncharacterized membrane protein